MLHSQELQIKRIPFSEFNLTIYFIKCVFFKHKIIDINTYMLSKYFYVEKKQKYCVLSFFSVQINHAEAGNLYKRHVFINRDTSANNK